MMYELTCKTCKHWRQTNDLWNSHKDSQEIGECTIASGNHTARSGPLAVAVCNNEAIYGELVTDARFGCCQHEG